MAKRLLLLMLILFIINGCGNETKKYTETAIYKGNSLNWTAEVKFQFDQSRIPDKKGLLIDKMSTRHYEYIKYIGPGAKIKNVQYSFKWNDGLNASTSNIPLDKTPYIIKSGVGISETTSKISAEKAKIMKLGDYKYAFPKKNEVIVLRIKWMGKEELINLKTESSKG